MMKMHFYCVYTVLYKLLHYKVVLTASQATILAGFYMETYNLQSKTMALAPPLMASLLPEFPCK